MFKCGICKRTVREGSRQVEGLGYVGDECVKRLGGLERAFALLSERHRHPQAYRIRLSLRRLGFNAYMRADVVSGYWRVYLKGGTVKEGDRRVAASVYGQWLLEQAARYEPVAA